MRDHYLKTLLIFWITFITISCSAQRLPNIQKENLWADVPKKIDGDLNDWGAVFRAYNNATSIFYTISNNSTDLYLAIKVPELMVFSKVIGAGITFSISDPSDKKKGMTLTYPLLSPKDRSKMLRIKNDTTIKGTKLLNEELHIASKEITVTGYRDITDSVISVYNEFGIKAAAGFDINKIFVIEMAVPLKHLKPVMNVNEQFGYNIRLNPFNPVTNMPGQPDAKTDRLIQMMLEMKPSIAERITPTDLSGTYTLARPK